MKKIYETPNATILIVSEIDLIRTSIATVDDTGLPGASDSWGTIFT